MKRKWTLVADALLLSGLVYAKYFNPLTSEFINQYPPLRALASFLLFFLGISLLSKTVKYLYSKRNKIPRGKKNNVHYGIENVARFIIGVGLVMMLLVAFGINPRELITSLTIVAAAIAILTKEYIVDFVSGIYLSFSNTFEINDYVRIADQKGKIVEISMLKVKILNDDDDIVIIPNSKVYYNEIINYTKRDVRLMSIDFQIALKYINSIEQLEKEIIAALESFSNYIEPRSYNLKVVAMKMDHLELKFQYTLVAVDMDLQRKIRKRTIREVFNFISSKKQ